MRMQGVYGIGGLALIGLGQALAFPGGHDLVYGKTLLNPSFTGNAIFVFCYIAAGAFAFILPYLFYIAFNYFCVKSNSSDMYCMVSIFCIGLFSALYYIVKYAFFIIDSHIFIIMNTLLFVLIYLVFKYKEKLGQVFASAFSFLTTYWLFSYSFPF